MHASTLKAMHEKLLKWYDFHKRKLPWRDSGNPYYVWLSEIMLQQTRIETVLPYFHKFIHRFPTVFQLAEADEDEVTGMWAGLGYYSRARNLRKAAIKIVEEHGGEIPENFEDLLAIPGIGNYTASAVCSMAFGQPYASVDGNLERVIARIDAMQITPKEGSGKDHVRAIAQKLVEKGRPGDINQAFMDLSSTICLPKTPQCLICPLKDHCKARAEGIQADLPVKRPKKAMKELNAYGAIIFDKTGKKFLIGRRPEKAWLAKMWDLPWQLDKIPGLDADKKTGLQKVGKRIEVKRTITNHKITMHYDVVQVSASAAQSQAKLTKHLQDAVVETTWQSIEQSDNLPRTSAKALKIAQKQLSR